MRSKFKWIYALLAAFMMQFSFAQEKTITGVVSDATGPLPGANVIVKGTTRGTQTDFDGKYAIKAKTGEILEISFTGYDKKSVTVGASSSINVKLEQGVKLNEVVVEGYRTTTKATTVVAQSTVSSKTIENRPNASFIQTLQGQVAGLNIASGSGQPGAASSVILRGAATILGNTDPLYVIDGIPTTSDNFRSINPSDIESVTVLKDAAATAIYGNRGTNGVIVIKTKSGDSGESKTTFRYSANTGFTQLQKSRYSFADSRELLTLEKIRGVGRGVTLTDQEIANYNINTDWLDYFFKTGTTTEHQMAVETSGKSLNSYTSLSYLNQEGILATTGLKRFTLRSNINGKSNDDKFTYATNLSLGYSKSNQATNLGTGAVNRNYVLGALQGAPYVSPSQYINSEQLLELYGEDGTLLYTPLFLIDKLNTFGNQTNELRALGTTDFGYKIFKNTTLRSRSSFEYIESRLSQYEHPISFNSLIFLQPGQEFGGFEDINNRREFRFNQLWQVDYEKVFAQKHTFNALLNAEYYFAQVNANNMRQRGLDPRTFVPDTGSGYLPDISAHDFYGPQGSASKLKSNLISYFALLSYDFDKRYGLDVSYRYDGTNRFLKDYAWGSFWSVGGRWNINNESFLKDSKTVQTMKLRASYGSTGNQRLFDGTEFVGLNPPPTRDTYSNAGNVYNGQSGYVVNFGANDLQWETTYTGNLGFDLDMFKRLRAVIDVYQRKTTDLFYDFPVSPTTGTTTIQKNTDIVVKNTGIDLSLSYDLVKNENLKFVVRSNVNYNKNRVSDISQNNGRYPDGNYITANGTQVLEFYVVPYVGVNPSNGNLLFLDRNNNLTESPNVGTEEDTTDRRATGKSRLPVYQGGFGFDLDYKGFYASSSFTFVKDVWRFDFDLDNLYDPTQLGQFAATDALLNAWSPINTGSNIPSLDASNYALGSNSDRFLKDASYIRLRNLQFGYKVPKRFLDKTFMSSVSFFVQGENLYTWTKWQGLDAESNRFADQSQYPTPRIYSLGLEVKF